MKVLLVTNEDPGHPIGGLGTFIRDYSTELRKHAEVKILLLRLNRPEDPVVDEEPSELIDYCISVEYTFPTENREARLFESALFILNRMKPILQEYQPNIIHCNDRHTWVAFRHFPQAVFSFHLSVPDLVGLRGLDTYWLGEHKIDKDACAKAGAVIVYSRFMRQVVWDQVCDFASPMVLPLGFDPSQYRSDKPADRIVIAFFGRLVQSQKGFIDFLQAVDMIPEEYFQRYNIQINVWGKGEIPDHVPTRRVARTGFLEGDDLKTAYAETHIVVMPSKYEPFGLVGLEALASGCLLLCTEGLGMDEFLVPGKNYLPVQSDPFDIREKMVQVLENPGKYLGREQSQRDSVAHWTWNRSVQEHLKVYQQVMVGRGDFLKWAYGRSGIKAVESWRKSGEARKRKMTSLFQWVAEKIPAGKTLVLSASEEERKIFEGTGKEVYFHSYLPDQKGFVHFMPEFILLAPNTFDNAVFLYGPEFLTNLELSLRELLRVVRDRFILGISFGEAAFGQTLLFESSENIKKVFRSWPFFEIEWEEVRNLEDGFDGREKKILVAQMKKRPVAERKVAV